MPIRSVRRAASAVSSSRPATLGASRGSSRGAFVEGLERRTLLTIDVNVVAGGTLNINPMSSIYPADGNSYDYMSVLLTTVPGTSYGTMYKINGASTTVWGTTTGGTMFAPDPSAYRNQRIYTGEGLQYVNRAGTAVGTTESIPVKFSNATGFTQKTDTLVIHVVAPEGAPEITTQPVSQQSVTKGNTVTLSVVAKGSGTLTYQWYRGVSPNGFDPISGATANTYTPPAASAAGSYMYWVKVSNSTSSVASQTATVFVGSPAVVNAGGPYTVAEKGSVTLAATATDPDKGLYLVYAWDFNNNGIYGENSTAFGDERGQNAVYTNNYQTDGPAAVTLRLKVTNDKAIDTYATATLNVTDAAPTGGTFVNADSAGTLKFSNVVDTPADLASMNYSYDFNNDGVYDLTTTSSTVTVPSAYLAGYLSGVPVRAKATDSSGLSTPELLAGVYGHAIVVNTLSDTTGGVASYNAVPNANVSLRDAIALAESDADADQIVFAPSLFTSTLTPLMLTRFASDATSNTAFTINTPIAVVGPNGNNGLVLTGRGATANYRAFTVNAGGSLTLQNLNVRDFSSYGSGVVGGAVYALGKLNVRRSAFYNNTVNSTAGGRGWGGAIAAEGASAVVTIDNSTFSLNTAGVPVNGTGAGGAIAAISGANLTLRNDTISGNVASTAAGLYVNGSSGTTAVSMSNTILTGNTGGTTTPFDYFQIALGGTVNTSGTNNLIGLNSGYPTGFNGSSGTANPNLAALASNGGPTMTMAIPLTSAACNAGVAFADLTVDQRGNARAVGAPDIGAYETQMAVTTQPASQTVFVGSLVSFTAAAAVAVGTPTPAVQWQVSSDGGTTFTNVANATSTTLTVNTGPLINGFYYRAVFTSSVGTVATTPAKLTLDTVLTLSGGAYAITRGSATDLAVTGPAGTATNYRLDWLTGLAVTGNATVTVTNDLGPDDGQGALKVTVDAGSVATFTNKQHLASLAVNGRATFTAATGGVVRVGGLAVGPAGTLDLGTADLVYDYTGTSPMAAVRAMLLSGRAGGAWTGYGLVSGTAKTNAAANTTLAYMEAADYSAMYGTAAKFGTQTIDATTVLVRYTTVGDTNLDRKTDFNDFLRLQNGFGQTNTSTAGGDLNNDGKTDFTDFLLMQNAFGAKV